MRKKKQVVLALKAGANNYVIKPFTNDLMAAKCRETLSIKSPLPEEPKPESEVIEQPEQKEEATLEQEKQQNA